MSEKGTTTKTSHIEKNDLVKLLNYLKTNKKEWKFYLFVNIAIYTGLKISNILDLKYSDLYLKKNIQVNNQNIKINIELHNIIYSFVEENIELDLNSSIFINRYDTRIISKSYINTKLKSLMKICDIKNNNICTHSLRKTFAYKVLETNNFSIESLNSLSKYFGHTTIDITRDYLNLPVVGYIDVFNISYDNLINNNVKIIYDTFKPSVLKVSTNNLYTPQHSLENIKNILDVDLCKTNLKGIYFLLDINKDIIYIGKSTNCIKNRLRSHYFPNIPSYITPQERLFIENKKNDSKYFTYIEVNGTNSDIVKMEITYIEKYKPIYNRQYVTNT